MKKDNKDVLLQMDHVYFGYDKENIVHDVSINIALGEMIGLLGPNGAGKTTLLRLLSGFLQPRQGAVFLQGRIFALWGRQEVARRIAMVQQEFHMPYAFTVDHLVSLGRVPYLTSFFGYLSKDDRIIIEGAMYATNVYMLRQRVFNELSGGEKQRVMIAMALAQQPTILLLDEPTSHLDIKYQVETLELIQELHHKQGISIIASVHDLNLAARYFPRLLLFQHRVIADAGPTEILDPDLLHRVYDMKVHIGILRGSANLSVLPSDQGEVVAHSSKQSKQPWLHLIAGGGSGEVLMRALADEHIPFSAGALHIGDSDHTLALLLAEEVISEQPYTPITSMTQQKVHKIMEHVALLVVCPVLIGPGNIALLREALEAAERGVPIVLLTSVEEFVEPNGHGGDVMLDNLKKEVMGRDYNDGEGSKLVLRLLELGAIIANSVKEALCCIRSHDPVKKVC